MKGMLALSKLVCCVAAVLIAVGCGDGAEQDRVVVDLIEQLPVAEVVHSRPILDLGSDEARRCLVSGWHEPEVDGTSGETFVWAVSDRAVVETELLATKFTGLGFRARAFSWDGAPEQRVRVILNGHTLGETVLGETFADHELKLPPEAVRFGRNRITFEFTRTARPADHLTGSTDERDLAAAFRWLRFGPAPEQPSPAVTGAPEVRGDDVVLVAGTGVRFRLTAPAHPMLVLEATAGPPGRIAPDLLVAVTDAAGPWAPGMTAVIGGASGGPVELALDFEPGTPVDVLIAASGDTEASGPLFVGSPRVVGEPVEAVNIPSVLLLVVDTLRADYLGCYGAPVNTPVVDGLAATGVRFANARSHIPITGPSHASLFTSLLPMEHGVHNNAQELRAGIPTLAQSLAAGGRRTAAVISLGVLQRKFGFDRGFDSYGDEFPRDWLKDASEVTDEALSVADGLAGAPWFLWAHYSDPHEPYAPTDASYPEFELRLDGNPVGVIDAGGRGFHFKLELPPGESVLEFVPIDDGEPGRTYRVDNLLIKDPSIEVEPLAGWKVIKRRLGRMTYESEMPASVTVRNPSDAVVVAPTFISCKKLLRKVEIRQAYAQETEFVDRQIGRLLAGLETRGMMDNTLVVFLSDHGEGLGDHNHVGHISQVYDSLLHVPLILTWPGRLPEGAVVDEPVGLIDVFPTVAGLVGAESPARATGLNLVPLMFGEDLAARPFIAATYRPESYSDKRAILLDGYKYIHSWKDEEEKEELYHVAGDPGELDDLATTRPELLEELRSELNRRLAEMAGSAPVDAELSEEERAHLRALGYLH